MEMEITKNEEDPEDNMEYNMEMDGRDNTKIIYMNKGEMITEIITSSEIDRYTNEIEDESNAEIDINEEDMEDVKSTKNLRMKDMNEDKKEDIEKNNDNDVIK